MLPLLASMALLFLGSMSLSYGLVRATQRWRQRGLGVEAGAVVRLRTLDGFYRARLAEVRTDGWTIDAPLRQGVPVPLRVGERLTLEVAVPNGCVVGRTHVAGRRSDPPQFLVKVPGDARRIDRRQEPRTQRYEGTPIRANGAPAELVDLSLQGLRFRTAEAIARGDAVSLSLPDGLGEVVAWVLDVSPDRFGVRAGCLVRARFSLPLDRFPAESVKLGD